MLKIKNKKIVGTVRDCISMNQKAKGLMFSKENKDLALVFYFPKAQKVALHMWFVFYPIDVIYLDYDKKIIEIKENFKPWRYFNPKNKSNYVIEFSAGIISKNKVKIGDKVDW